MTTTLGKQLAFGIKDLGLEASDHQVDQLIIYLELLQKWNKAYNLTAIREPEKILSLHLLDSLSISVHITGNSFIDVGTGPGLPGIPLAIMHPDKTFLLLDSNGKKVRFLFQAIKTLKLNNAQEIQTRAESYQPEVLFDGVLSRAYANVLDMLHSCSHLLAKKGHFYAMKGKYPESELSQLPKNYMVNKVHQLNVPGIDAERHLVDMCFSEDHQ